MEQSNNQSTTICPICKSENPAISVCLTCGSKIKHEHMKAKEFISRPVWLTVLAGFYALGFMKNAFFIMYQKNGPAVIALTIVALIDIAIAYGLWQLKKWAWMVVVITCWLGIVLVWIIPILLWVNPAEGLKFAYRPLFQLISSVPSLSDRFTSAALKASLIRAIMATIINGAILWYFYSNFIRGMFSDDPIAWKAAKY